MAVVSERAVHFEEVDAAGIVFFARFFYWCHEAMERFFDPIAGGYVDLITRRRVGFPAVHLEADWKSPVRYGDVVRIETSVANVGTTSATLRFVFTRLADAVHVATIDHVVVCTDLDSMTKQPLPSDCRALLEAHRSAI
ncbi:MAG TPA: acyl-CoA thioesterase [Labilithrix sp.]|nr:acyl-CoA thioesterase [Labilithrix sp.]